MRTVYLLNRGRAVGTTELGDMAPLPLDATTEEPPEAPAGQVAIWRGSQWVLVDDAPVPEAQPRPVLRLTSVVPDAEHAAMTAISADLDDVTCPVGTVLTVTAELVVGDQRVPISEAFRMPLRARDGREKVLLATMDNGLATIAAPMRESGVWEVTERAINEALPAELQMEFSGIRIFVVEG